MNFSSIVARILRELGIIRQPAQNQTAPTRQAPAQQVVQPSASRRAAGFADHYACVAVFVPYLDVLTRPDVVVGAVVTFRQEPENKFDRKAVAVVIGRKRIGYLFRGEYQDIVNACINARKTVSGRIVRVDKYAPDVKSSSIAIDIYLY